MDAARAYTTQFPEGALPSPGTAAASSSRSEAPTTLASPTAVEAMMGASGSAWDQQLSWLQQKISSLEDQLHMARRDRGEAEQRSTRLNEQVDRLWQELADERRERQVEANEERMLRLSDSAEIREGLGRVKASQVEPRFREYSNDPTALETFVEESEDREDEQAPELTALEQEDDSKGHRRHLRVSGAASSEGISEATLYAAKHAEAQLKRAAADARRAEAMVRREVARAVAEARAYLEDTGQQQQEFWAARQRVVGGMTGGAASSSTSETQGAAAAVSVECLGLRLDSLEMHLRARLEATERSFDAFQSSIDDVQNMPAQVEGLIRQEMDALRFEVKESFNEERSRAHARAQALVRDFTDEIEKSVMNQAVAEVRADVVATVQLESNLLREELVRARSDEASRIAMRIHALEERVNSLESRSNRTKVAPESEGSAGSASVSRIGSHSQDPPPAIVLQQFGESVAQLESTIGDLLRKSNEQRNEVQADSLKLRKEIEDVSKRVNRLSASEMADLQQRFEIMEEKLRQHDPLPRPHAEGGLSLIGEEASKARLGRLEQAVEQQGQVVTAAKRCITDVLHRLSSKEEEALQSLHKALPSMVEKLDDYLHTASSGDANKERSSVQRSLSEEPVPARTRAAHTPSMPVQGGSLGQLPPGHGTPVFPAAQLPGNSLVSGANTFQMRQDGPVPSPGVPYNMPQARVTGQPYSNSVQRTWSVPTLRNVPDALSTTVKVVPPGPSQMMGAPHRSPSIAGGIARSGTPVGSQAGTPYNGSVAAPAAPSSTSSAHLRPGSMSRGVSPKPGSSMQSAANPRMQKPTDSPYMRYRPVKMPASPILPGRPVQRP